MSVSIIIPSLNELNNTEETVLHIQETIEIKNYEIIIVESGGTNLNRIKQMKNVKIIHSPIEGPARARNLGAKNSKNDWLIFIDSHIRFKKRGIEQMIDGMKRYNGLITPCITRIEEINEQSILCAGYGYRWKNLDLDIEWIWNSTSLIHEIPFACGCCMAISKKIFQDIGEFDYGFFSWGEEDTEFSLRTWLMGYSVLCNPGVIVGHQFRNSHPYEVKWNNYIYNKIRLCLLHFNNQNIIKFIRSFSNNNKQYIQEINKAILRNIIENKINERKRFLLSKRKRNDNWFFQKFPLADLS